MLDSGMEHQCILYREAMDDLVYRGIISIAGKESQISVMERLLYLQGLANLLDAYPNLNIRVIDGFVVDEIKHTTLPSLYLSLRLLRLSYVPGKRRERLLPCA